MLTNIEKAVIDLLNKNNLQLSADRGSHTVHGVTAQHCFSVPYTLRTTSGSFEYIVRKLGFEFSHTELDVLPGINAMQFHNEAADCRFEILVIEINNTVFDVRFQLDDGM